MGVTRFESVVSAQSVGTADIDKLAQSFEKLAGSIETAGTKATKVSEHPGFDHFAEQVKKGIEDPLGAAAEMSEKLLKSVGPLGAGIAAAAGVLGTAAVAGFEAAHSLAAYGTEIERTSLRLGLTTRETGQFEFAVKRSGGEMETFVAIQRKLSQGLVDTSEDGKKARAGLAELGVQAYDATTGKLRPMSDILLQLSERLNAMEEGPKRVAVATQIMGRGAIQALPDILKLAEGVERAKALGLGPSDDDVRRWESYHEKLVEAEFQWERLVRAVKEPIAGTFVLTMRGFAGDTSDIGAGAAAALRGQIGKATPEELRERLERLSSSGAVDAHTMEELENAVQLAIDKNLFRGIGVSGGMTIDQSRISRALSATDDHGELEKAKEALKVLQDQLRSQQQLKAPYGTVDATVDEIEKQKAVVQAIEARVEATRKLKEAESALEGFEREMLRVEENPIARIFSRADDLISRGANRGRTLAAAIQGAQRIAAKDAADLSGTIDDMLAGNSPEREAEIRKRLLDRVLGPEMGSGHTLRFVSEQPVLPYSPQGYTSPAEQLRFAQDFGRRALALYGVRAGLQGVAPEEQIGGEFSIREATAKRVYDAELRIAELGKTEGERENLRLAAKANKQQEIFDAEVQRDQARLQMALQQRQDFQNFAVGAFDALRSGGARSFFSSFERSLENRIVSQFAASVWGDPEQHTGLSGMLPRPAAGSFLGKALSGTFLGPDPLKDAGAAKLSVAGSQLSTAAMQLMGAARALSLSRTGGGGGFAGGGAAWDWWGGWGDGGSGDGGEVGAEGVPEGSALPTDGYPLGGSGGGFGFGRAAGIGTAALSGAFGLYSGIKQGGARGGLTAAGSTLAAAGAIMALASKALSFAGPAGLIAGMGLGLVTSLLGDPKRDRDEAENRTLMGARYVGPSPQTYARDRYGRSIDYDTSGAVRPVIQFGDIHISAINQRGVADAVPVLLNGIAEGMEGRVSPRFHAAVRNVSRGAL